MWRLSKSNEGCRICVAAQQRTFIGISATIFGAMMIRRGRAKSVCQRRYMMSWRRLWAPAFAAATCSARPSARTLRLLRRHASQSRAAHVRRARAERVRSPPQGQCAAAATAARRSASMHEQRRAERYAEGVRAVARVQRHAVAASAELHVRTRDAGGGTANSRGAHPNSDALRRACARVAAYA